MGNDWTESAVDRYHRLKQHTFYKKCDKCNEVSLIVRNQKEVGDWTCNYCGNYHKEKVTVI